MRLYTCIYSCVQVGNKLRWTLLIKLWIRGVMNGKPLPNRYTVQLNVVVIHVCLGYC